MERLGFGFTFAELATRAGLVRLDRLFLEAARGRGRGAACAADGGARGAGCAGRSRTRATWWWRWGRTSMAFVAALFGIEAETLALARETHALDPIHACKRLFVQRQAVKKYPDPSGFDGAALRAALEAVIGERADRAGVRRSGGGVGEGGRRRGAGPGDALCRLGDADPGRGVPRIRGDTLFRVPHRVDPQHLVPVETIERDGVTMLRLPEAHWRHARGLRADRSRG